MSKIDLHIHSNISDGKFSPKEIIDLALEKNIPTISITDHDDVRGIKDALKYAKGKDIEIIPGIEITITPPKTCRELHMVGLFIDSENEEIRNVKKRHNVYGVENAKKIIKNLNDLGYKITFQELWDEGKGEHLGRPLIARILMRKYPEEFKVRSEVFDKLLGKRGKAFVMAKGTSMEKAIEIIHNAGGIAIIAHPWYLGDNMEEVIKEFVKLGGDGIEREYKQKESIPEGQGKILDRLINEHNLIISGGTDFHNGEKEEMGDRGLSNEELDLLKKKAGSP